MGMKTSPSLKYPSSTSSLILEVSTSDSSDCSSFSSSTCFRFPVFLIGTFLVPFHPRIGPSYNQRHSRGEHIPPQQFYLTISFSFVLSTPLYPPLSPIEYSCPEWANYISSGKRRRGTFQFSVSVVVLGRSGVPLQRAQDCWLGRVSSDGRGENMLLN